MFRNYYKEWLVIFPIDVVYYNLDYDGKRYDQWRQSLIEMMGTKMNHPLSTVLLQKKSSKQICNYMKKELIKYGKSGKTQLTNFTKFLEDEYERDFMLEYNPFY